MAIALYVSDAEQRYADVPADVTADAGDVAEQVMARDADPVKDCAVDLATLVIFVLVTHCPTVVSRDASS
jgi:hypothetical protein